VSTQAKMMPAVMSVPPRESVAQAVQKSDARVSNTRESGTPASAIPTSSTAAADAAQEAAAKEPAPLSFKIGSAYITPVGFMDFTFVGRSVTTGSGIGTNFGNIPFNNTMQGHLTETRLSAQNSRFGVRVDTKVKNASILGYLESDFLGFVPTNAAVSSNSYSFRLRLYWASIRQGKFEILGGQSWSLLTPGRKGISALPGDLFYTQNIDTNYQAGLVWGRIPQFRFVYHASKIVALGFSAENPEQYIGGSAGGGTTTLPSALVTPYANLLNNGTTTLNVPNLHPDMVGKIAFDPKVGKRDLHLEVGGVVRSFKLFNPISNQSFTTTGGGGQVNINFELVKNLRILTNNFFSDGGGRYIFGQAPDLVVRADGSPSLLHSFSTVSGLEVQARKNTLIYGYYGGVYIGRSVVVDTTNTANPRALVGYGYAGSGNGQNRSIQEGTFGFTQTFWRDPKFGALQFMGQYSYLTRNPWFVATGQPDNAHANIYFLNLRYALPGSAPAKVE
ncbi:MAG: hypothetical protein J2P41_11555, partial [Blastocatellia bacterium]|nr:hypothetical protein [Blastocatellia bacterium]